MWAINENIFFFSKDAVDDDLVLHENDIWLTKVVCVLCDSDELLLTSFFFCLLVCLFISRCARV